jgi:hypothetical protein
MLSTAVIQASWIRMSQHEGLTSKVDFWAWGLRISLQRKSWFLPFRELTGDLFTALHGVMRRPPFQNVQVKLSRFLGCLLSYISCYFVIFTCSSHVALLSRGLISMKHRATSELQVSYIQKWRNKKICSSLSNRGISMIPVVHYAARFSTYAHEAR